MIGPDKVEVLVIGTGLMGASLAQAFAQNGVGVGLIGRRQEISFPVPRILIQQAQKNEPWPL